MKKLFSSPSVRVSLGAVFFAVVLVLVTCTLFLSLFNLASGADRRRTLLAHAHDLAYMVSGDMSAGRPVDKYAMREYAVFTETAFDVQLWIARADGTFYASSDETVPRTAAEMSESGQAAFARALAGEDVPATDAFGRVLSVVVPVLDKDGTTVLGALFLHCNNIDYGSVRQTMFWLISCAVFVAVVFAAVYSVVVVRHYTEPLQNMNVAAKRMTEGDYTARTDIRLGGEISSLSASLNHLAETLSAKVGELSGEKEKLNTVLENVSNGLCLFDTSLRPQLTNSAYRAMAAGLEDEETVKDLLLRAMEERAVLTRTVEGRDIFQFIASPTYAENGEVDGCVLVAQDVSESERLERSRKRFISDVSHEFRTPLTVIKGYVELLADGAVTTKADVRRTYAKIAAETDALGALVSDMLELSRAQSGRLELPLETVDAVALCETLCDGMRAVANKKGVNLCFTPADVPPVRSNPARLRQVLLILTDNAVKFTPAEGFVSVSCALAGEMVELSVRDSGVGILPEDIPYVFERFYKADKVRPAGEATGSGLGLSIAKAIVDALGGTIRVESEPGKGAVFTVSVPVAKGDENV